MKEIELPDGSVGEFPDEMTDEAIGAVLRKQFAPPTAMQRVGQGAADLAAGFGKVGSYALAPYDLAADAVQGRRLGTAHRERMGSINQFATDQGAGDWTSVVNQAAPEVMATMGPMGRAAALTARPFLTDVVLSGGMEGAKAGAAGEDVLPAAGKGAAGAGAGRALVRTLAGAKSLATPAAKALIDRGITGTPGQLLGGVARSVEDKASSFPIVGDILNYSRSRTIGRFGNEAINEAMAPLASPSGPLKKAMASKFPAVVGERIEGYGDDAVDAAQRRISDAYGAALKDMHVGPRSIDAAIGKTDEQLGGIALLDERQIAQLNGFINLRLRPHIESGGLTGEAAKKLDSELGYQARKYSRSVNPGDHPFGEALYTLQTNFRTAMAEGAKEPGAFALLERANEAHRKLLPIVRAADRASAQGGKFTPWQLERAAAAHRQEPTQLTTQAQQVLPSRVPDSGTAGRMLLNIAAGGGAAYVGPGTAAATALGALVYSPAGLRLFARGVEGLVPDGVYKRLASLPPESMLGYIGAMARNPQTREATERVLGHVAAQMGRQIATQPEGASQ